MVLLPIVERELRVASRRKATHRVRVWTTAAGLLVGFFFILTQQIAGGFMPNLGQVSFNVLTYYTFGVALLAGVVLAADCISEEKREGTLGLLFLTDLKGYDVVFGKLAAVGLTALYGLVAVLPVTGLPLLMGGVTGSEYWRVSLALVNALFFAMAIGIFASTCCRQASKAAFNTFVLLLMMTVGLPIVGGILSAIPLPANLWYAVSISPYYPFSLGSETSYFMRPERYWISLAASHLFAWLLLIMASLTLPRAWQDKPVRQHIPATKKSSDTIAAKPLQSFARRAGLLDTNPILWLIAKDYGAVQFWSLSFAVVLGVAITFVLLVDHDIMGVMFASSVVWVFGLALKIWLAFQAAKFFVESRRNGALEMLLSTPLTARQVIAGQWLALKHIFLWPFVVVLVTQFVLLFWFSGDNSMRGLSLFRATSTISIGPINLNALPLGLLHIVAGLYQVVRWGADMLALGWMGMWLGLTAKRPSLAGVMTILLVMVFPGVIFCVPGLFFDLFFILWARHDLEHRFRIAALPQYRPNYSAGPAFNRRTPP